MTRSHLSTRAFLLGFFVSSVPASLGGCSSSSSPADGTDSGVSVDTGVVDSGTGDTGSAVDAAGDADVATDTAVAPFPAFPPNAPQILKGAGAVVAAPKIVTITFPGDVNAAAYEAFGDGLGDSAYWKTTGEYGVGKATSGAGNHVRLPDAMPATLDEEGGKREITDWLTALFSAPAKNGLPAHDPANRYVIYADPKASLTYVGEPFCGSNHHRWAIDSAVAIGGVDYRYLLVGQCDFGHGVLATTTANASSLIACSVTSPSPSAVAGAPDTVPSWFSFDDAHLADSIFHELDTNIGGVCELYSQSFLADDETGFKAGVQRLWSNASAAAGHDPCAPIPTAPYFDVVPLGTEAISPTIYGTKVDTKGFAVKIGDTKTFQIGFFSDAKTEPWTLTTTEKSLPPQLGYFPWTRPDNLEVTIDHPTGKNGDIANVTVKVKSYGLGSYGKLALLTFISTAGGVSHYRSVLFMPGT